ncbi:hypothetical protein JRO89_XS13G0003600 [Xanthoceras sorbifolium]|uniref:Uncharacterized protein n=1 Tax=Xanthoceras sorbifolium TaxID=99658 RepID=A0ABQ8H5Q7_9ROSI|nr:hypothetical protein JRO89_XS13G0003600 [Xanthoceras sorbifolium]
MKVKKCRTQKAEVMGFQAATTCSYYMCSSNWVALNSPQQSLNLSKLPLKTTNITYLPSFKARNNHLLKLLSVKTRAAVDENQVEDDASPLLVQEEQPNTVSNNLFFFYLEIFVAVEEILSALSVIEKSKIDPSGFLETLGGSTSPGRTWMLIFTAENQLKSGRYFPITAVQRFDAAGKRIENGVYLGPIGRLTFEGRFNWKKRILAFIFERIRIKIGFLKPIEISFGQKEDREPSTKDPFFIWFYIDEEIAVARGRSGGTAFWCQCRRVTSYSFE